MAMRDICFEPLAARRPSPERRHIGLGPCLANEDQALGCDPGLIFFPLLAPARDVRAILLAGAAALSINPRMDAMGHKKTYTEIFNSSPVGKFLIFKLVLQAFVHDKK